jgi:hypothetical protein
MKRNIFFLIIAVAFSSLMFTSCDDQVEGTLYEVGDKVHAAFASTVQLVEMLPADGNQIKVPVYRGGKSDTEANVTVEMNQAASIPAGTFTLTNPQVNFPVGQNVAYAVITYADINALSAGATYVLTLTLTNEEQLSVSEAKSIKVQAQRKLTFAPLAIGTFTSEFFEDSWEVEVLKAAEADVYRILDCYYNNFHITFSVSSDNSISFSSQPMGYVSADYGMTSFTMPRETYTQPSKDGKTFNLWSEFRVSAGSFGLFEEVLVLP